MRLYVLNNQDEKVYLDKVAVTRQALAEAIGSKFIQVADKSYPINKVLAEKSGDNAPVSTVLGGALGLAGGMPGVIIGGILGAMLGHDSDRTEQERVNIFNGSKVNEEN